MRTAAFILVAISVIAAQESRPGSRPDSRTAPDSRAISLGELADAGREALFKLTGEDARYARELALHGEGMAHWKAGRTQDAIRVFETMRRNSRAGDGLPDETLAVISIVSILDQDGQFESAAEVAEDFARTARHEQERAYAWSLVATTNERAGNWARAADAWERVIPSAEVLGKRPIERLLRIARCRFHLGEVSVALGLVEQCLEDPAVTVPTYANGPSLAPEAAWAYAEYAARGGRLAHAKEFVATLPASVGRTCHDCLRVADAWIARDPAAMIQAVAAGKIDPGMMPGPGKLLGELGRPALDLLLARIAAGDEVAIELAGASGKPELIPALEKRYQASKEGSAEERAASIAITNLEFAARTASRPASRVSK